MERKFLEKIKKKLEKEKVLLEMELSSFAKKDVKPKGDWDTIFPKTTEPSEEPLDRAERIEEYLELLPVEFALEEKLKNVDLALKKIKSKNYGICENCKKKISKSRLSVVPETKFCIKCEKSFK